MVKEKEMRPVTLDRAIQIITEEGGEILCPHCFSPLDKVFSGRRLICSNDMCLAETTYPANVKPEDELP